MGKDSRPKKSATRIGNVDITPPMVNPKIIIKHMIAKRELLKKERDSPMPLPIASIVTIRSESKRSHNAPHVYLPIAPINAVADIIAMADMSLNPISTNRGLSWDITPTVPIIIKEKERPIFQNVPVRTRVLKGQLWL